MKKSTLFLSLILVLTLILSACGAPPTEAPAPEPTEPPVQATEPPVQATEPPGATEPPAAEPFRVAVVMPSAINDLAFSQSMYDALSRVQEEMGAENFEFVYSEGMFVVDDAAAAIRDYASQGYDLVIAHGSQYGSSLHEIAPDYPETTLRNQGTFTQAGTVNLDGGGLFSTSGGTTYNNGYLNNNAGVILVTGAGILNNDQFATINSSQSFTVGQSGSTLNNNGIVNLNAGQLYLNNSATFNNTRTFNIGAKLLDPGTTFTNSDAVIINMGANFNNFGTIINTGSGGTIDLSGTLNNGNVLNNGGLIQRHCPGVYSGTSSWDTSLHYPPLNTNRVRVFFSHRPCSSPK